VGKVPLQRKVGDYQELATPLKAYIFQISAYINGEVVVIDSVNGWSI
jgi:hypothetical protein